MNETAPKWQERFSRLANLIERKTNGLTNCGGCCVVAAAVGRALQEQGIPVRVVVKYHSEADIQEARANAPEGWRSHNDFGIDFPHGLAVFQKDGHEWIYDTAQSVRPYRGRWGSLTVEEATRMASTPVGWNEMFNRKHIPFIERATRRMLRSIEK